MTSDTRAVGIRLGIESDERTSTALALWHLNVPAPFGEVGTLASAVLDYSSPAAVEITLDHVWLFVYLGDHLVDGCRFGVLREREGDFGNKSLVLEGESADLLSQVYLPSMLTNAPAMSASFLRTEVQRWAWIRAAVKASQVITPWMWSPAHGQHEFGGSRPMPTELKVTVEPKMFGSRSIFFSQIGERLLGPAGYVGRDLDGFAEMMRQVADVTEQVEVDLVDPAECEQVASQKIKLSSFYEQVHEILSDTCRVEVLEQRAERPA